MSEREATQAVRRAQEFVREVMAHLSHERPLSCARNHGTKGPSTQSLEAQAAIKAAFPEAEFKVHRGTDPAGVYIDAYTKAADRFTVLDLISDRLVDLCVEEGLGIYVVPLPKEET